MDASIADLVTGASPGGTPGLTRRRVTMEDIADLGDRLDNLNSTIKNVVFKGTTKQAPEYNATQLAALCGKTRDQMLRLLDKSVEPDLPDGIQSKASTNGNRKFTLPEARAWVQKTRKLSRPAGSDGAVITIANFKGGVGKTVVAMALAQALNLKGYNVLAIDFDPQGSMSSLFGVSPANVQEDETVLPLMLPKDREGARDSLQSSIQSTYWDGIDLIPASHALFAGEFFLPLRQTAAHGQNSIEPDFRFWEVLDKALAEGIREHYDYIIIDTPPALSYMTMTTFWASDALLLPLPPEGIDFASSAQFWTMLADLSTGTTSGAPKDFAWVGAVPSKVDHQKMHTKEILRWMRASYKELLMQTEIPVTAAVGTEGMRYSTVYDVRKYVGAAKTLARAREAYDKLADEVDFMTRRTVWNLPA